MPLRMTLDLMLQLLLFLAEAICIHSDHPVRNSFPLTILKDFFFPQGKKNGKVQLLDSVTLGKIADSLSWEAESLTPQLCAALVQVQLQSRPRMEWQGASEAT